MNIFSRVTAALAAAAISTLELLGCDEQKIKELEEGLSTEADVRAALAGAVPFLHLFGIVAGGWQMGRAALVASRRLAEGSGEDAIRRAFAAARANS